MPKGDTFVPLKIIVWTESLSFVPLTSSERFSIPQTTSLRSRHYH